jgi:hypothetical protein
MKWGYFVIINSWNINFMTTEIINASSDKGINNILLGMLQKDLTELTEK